MPGRLTRLSASSLLPLTLTAAPAAVSSDIARLAAATEARVRQIEAAPEDPRRDDRRPEDRSGSRSPSSATPFAEVDGNAGPGRPVRFARRQADPTFKSLFTSWKKLDNLADGAIAVPSDKPVKTADFTSGYGVRSDPFRGRAAMHAGHRPRRARSARRSTPPPTAPSATPAGTAAATAISSSSTMAAASRPATATFRRSWSAPASASSAAS